MAEQDHRHVRALPPHQLEEGACVGQVVGEAVDVTAAPRRAAVTAKIVGEHSVATRRHVADEKAVAAAVLAVAVDDGERRGHAACGHPGLPDEASGVLRNEVASLVPDRRVDHSSPPRRLNPASPCLNTD